MHRAIVPVASMLAIKAMISLCVLALGVMMPAVAADLAIDPKLLEAGDGVRVDEVGRHRLAREGVPIHEQDVPVLLGQRYREGRAGTPGSDDDRVLLHHLSGSSLSGLGRFGV